MKSVMVVILIKVVFAIVTFGPVVVEEEIHRVVIMAHLFYAKGKQSLATSVLEVFVTVVSISKSSVTLYVEIMSV